MVMTMVMAMKWLLCLTLFSLCPLTTSVGNDFDFQAVDGDSSFDFDDNLDNMVLDLSSIQTDRNEDPMTSIDLRALDAQIERFAGNDIDSLLEELKGYHGITDDGEWLTL